MRLKTAKTYGFTLIELSIVLVIIGLIIGGVLAGKDMIRAAQVRKTLRTIEQYDTAVITFKNKYNCLPGDCLRATNFFAATSQPNQVTNGSGNGVVDVGDVNSDRNYFPNTERAYFFDHLANSKLMNIPTLDETGLITVLNTITIGGYISIYYTESTTTFGAMPRQKHYYFVGAAANDDFVNMYNTMLPMDAFAIDSKIDDGKPLSGIVAAHISCSGDDDCAGIYDYAAASGTCVSTASGNPYPTTTPNQLLCSLAIRAGF
jgi:prepilin-type N-terminal cleavage/methylation domain-containing protein